MNLLVTEARQQMTECSKVKDYIDKYLRDELDKRKRIYVEGHVKGCIMCSRYGVCQKKGICL